MGKTNKDRVGRVIEKFIKYVVWGANYEEIGTPILNALDRAEKRGRRKERRKATSEVCIYCPGLKDGECPHVTRSPMRAENAGCTVNFVKPFDAEKVNLLISNITKWTQCAIDNDDDCRSLYIHSLNEALQKLREELGVVNART